MSAKKVEKFSSFESWELNYFPNYVEEKKVIDIKVNGADVARIIARKSVEQTIKEISELTKT